MDARRRARTTVMVALVAVGAVAMVVSTQQDRIWWILAWFMIGMTCLSLLLPQLGDLLDDRLRFSVSNWSPWAFGAVVVVGIDTVGAAILWQLSPVVAIAGMVLLTVGLVGLLLWVGHRDAHRPDSRPRW